MGNSAKTHKSNLFIMCIKNKIHTNLTVLHNFIKQVSV